MFYDVPFSLVHRVKDMDLIEQRSMDNLSKIIWHYGWNEVIAVTDSMIYIIILDKWSLLCEIPIQIFSLKFFACNTDS